MSKCADIDECSSPEDHCSENAKCQNTVGSWICSCPEFFSGNGSTDGPCIDIDECRDGTHSCDGILQCNNKLGGYGCKCPSGYLMKGKVYREIDSTLLSGSKNLMFISIYCLIELFL